ncbi:acyltransferase [Pseudomonas sp. PB120]|uniref:acyltransferase family protein n=1 Tax=Pseudomonas sp. PB120 TaxID=2494700 RepID=UPI0012FD32A4|nr:acyltransferase [Pseudomonas sp. PB120]MVV47012.1 acyltransferase [Pseudomonas sp. PB120]
MKLNNALHRDNNNADLLRLVAACAVIWGHAYALVPGPVTTEPIRGLLGFDYSGSLAVEFFFFLSGILVTNSWLTNSSPLSFILARFFRVFPAVLVSAVACVFLLGPMLTTLPLNSYFADSSVFAAIFRHPYVEYSLPGVFEHTNNPLTNGSIWTIRYELIMYAMLLAAGLCGVFRHKIFATVVLVAILVISIVLPDEVEVIGLMNVDIGGRLPAFFAFGALLALYKDQASINFSIVCGLILFAWICRHGPAFQFVFYPAFLMTALWLMTTAPIKALRLPGDFSYGVYVFGWPIQKAVVAVFPAFSIHENQAVSIAAALALASISWYVVEKPCIRFGRQLSQYFAAYGNREANSEATLVPTLSERKSL